MTARKAKSKAKAKSQGPSPELAFFVRIISSLRLSEWLVLAATISVSLWSWFTYILTSPQDFGDFILVFGIALTAGSLIQSILVLYVRPEGTLRERIGWSSIKRSLSGAWIIILAPAVIITIVLLIATPPSTSTEVFDPDLSIYRIILGMGVLALMFTALGAGALFVVVVVPLGMLLAAVLPERESSSRRPAPTPWTRPQLAIGGGILLCAVGFGVSIASVAGSTASSRRGRMGDQFDALLRFEGNTVAIILTWFFVLALVALVIVNNRIEARRKKGSS